ACLTNYRHAAVPYYGRAPSITTSNATGPRALLTRGPARLSRVAGYRESGGRVDGLTAPPDAPLPDEGVDGLTCRGGGDDGRAVDGDGLALGLGRADPPADGRADDGAGRAPDDGRAVEGAGRALPDDGRAGRDSPLDGRADDGDGRAVLPAEPPERTSEPRLDGRAEALPLGDGRDLSTRGAVGDAAGDARRAPGSGRSPPGRTIERESWGGRTPPAEPVLTSPASGAARSGVPRACRSPGR